MFLLSYSCLILLFNLGAVPVEPQSFYPLQNLSNPPDFESHRISSYDRTGGNSDHLAIEPGETKVLAEITGPGAVTHFWNTIAAENYYPRMLILRFYWDGQETPSVQVPLGDFFGVGHGLDKPFQSFPVDVSSDGRARNCYWYMPFKKSAKVTVTHEGFETVRAFYYYIDYQTYKRLPDDILYFHAQYRQATPNPKVDLAGKNLDGKANYVLMETQGKGKYIGTVLSVQINQDGWFGEGDDMFFVDGVDTPTMTGTGSEDYFNDAWGFRLFCHPFHGVTVWEGYNQGDRGTAYKWHIADPVAFTKSLKATIEHGHANDRQDDFYSVAFWYQTLPSPEPPPLPNALDRLPDEGQNYAKTIFLNKELSEHQKAGRWEEAIKRIDEWVKENKTADNYGYWTLRKAWMEKSLNRFPEAVEGFKAVLEKSKKEDAKAVEQNAKEIHQLAERQLQVLSLGKPVRLYALADDDYEIFLDGKSIAKGGGRDRLNDHEISSLSGGTHILAVKCRNRNGRAGLAIQLSYRRGEIITDSGWKTSAMEEKGWNEKKFDDSQWRSAQETGILGEAAWKSTNNPLNFMAPFLITKVIWSPDGVQENQTVYFRKEIRIK